MFVTARDRSLYVVGLDGRSVAFRSQIQCIEYNFVHKLDSGLVLTWLGSADVLVVVVVCGLVLLLCWMVFERRTRRRLASDFLSPDICCSGSAPEALAKDLSSA